MRKSSRPEILEKPGEVLNPSFAGTLTIAPLKKRPGYQKSLGRRPLQATGWKPKGRWLVSLKRGSGSATTDRMVRGCDSLEDGRKTAEDYFKSGWDEAWVYEKS